VPANDAPDAVSPDLAREQLERILAYPALQSGRRRRDMLRFIVEETLAGRGSRIKAYAIAIAVFDRDETFDQQSDPIVRIEARRLRRDLDNYYATEGRDDPVRITVPKGGYVPQFAVQCLPAGTRSEYAGSQTVEKYWRKSAGGWPLAVTAVVVVLVALVSVVAWHWPAGTGKSETASMIPGQADGLGGPIVLVMPFGSPGADQQTGIFAAGITHELVTDLLRFPYFRVHTPAAGPERTPDDGTIALAEGIDASYVVSGTVRSNDGHVAIGVQLNERASSQVLWSETFRRSLTARNLMDIESEIAAEIATIIGQPYGMIANDVSLHLSASAPSLASYACVLKAYAYRRTSLMEQYRPTRDCLEAAVIRDPEYAQAWAMLAYLRLDAGRYGYDADVDSRSAYALARAAASHSLLLDQENVEALKALSFVYHYTDDFEKAQDLARKAVKLNPNDPDTLAHLGWRLSVRGNREEGIPLMRRAIARSVKPPPWYFHMIAIDHLMRGEYEEMLGAAERASADGSSVSFSLLAIAYGALGNKAEARQNLNKMAERWPLLASDPAAAFGLHKLEDGMVTAIVAGLRNAGWRPPETTGAD